MKSYEIPNTENLTQETARQTYESLSADVIADKEHPYTNKSHPQHRDMFAAVQKLVEAKSEGDKLSKMCDDAIAEQNQKNFQKQESLRTSAQADLDKLRSLGVEQEYSRVHPDITEAQAGLLRMRLMNAEGGVDNMSQLPSMIQKYFTDYGETSDMRRFFNTFVQGDVPETLRQDLFENYIFPRIEETMIKRAKLVKAHAGTFGA